MTEDLVPMPDGRSPTATDRWRQLMFERSVRQAEHWERCYQGAVEGSRDAQVCARKAIVSTLAAVQYAQHPLTVLAFPVPTDVGSREMDDKLWPVETSESRDGEAGEGPGINGEWMPCLLCGEPLTGADVKLKGDKTPDKGLYCSRCSSLGP